MHKCISFFRRQCKSMLTGFIINISVKDYFRSQIFGSVYLQKRGCRRHYDNRFYPLARCSQRHSLGVISGRGRDQSLFLFFFCQRADFVIGAPDLISSCQLHVLWF